MFSETDDEYWWGDLPAPDYSSPKQKTNPTDQFLPGFYGDTSGGGVYDAGGNDYWSPLYEPTTSPSKTATSPWDFDLKDIMPPYKSQEKASPSSQTSQAGTQYKPPTGQTSITTMSKTKPSMPLPKYTLPERDTGRVKELRAQELGYPMRKYRQEARRMLPKIAGMEGPMRGEAMRKWTEGLGTGISSISREAGLGAERLYGVERGEEINAGLTNFSAEMQDYLNQYGTTQTTKMTYQYGGTS